MHMRWIIGVVAVLVLISGASAAHTYTSWEQDLNTSVSAIDTNEYGTVTFIGTVNTLYCYNLVGTETWNLTVNGTPQKIVSTQDGDRTLLYTTNDTVYYVNGTDGTVIAEYRMPGVGRAKDVTMKKDGQVFAFAYENVTYVVDDVSPGFIGTPYSWYEIPVTTGTWHKLAYQATNDILTLSKTGESRVYMVNATNIPYHIPITINNNQVDHRIENEYVNVTIVNQQFFDFYHNDSTTIEIWRNWTVTGGYTDPVTFDVQAWDSANHTAIFSLSNITLNHTQSATLLFQNNVYRTVTKSVEFDDPHDNLTFVPVVYDDFDDGILNTTMWTSQPTSGSVSIAESDGVLSYSAIDRSGRSGVYSTYRINQQSVYTMNTTLTIYANHDGTSYTGQAGFGGFVVGVADPATVAYNDVISGGGQSGILTHNAMITHGYVNVQQYYDAGSGYKYHLYGSMYPQVRDDTGTVVDNITPYNPGYAVLNNVKHTISSRYDFVNQTISTKVYNAVGTLVYDIPTQSFASYNLRFNDDLRTFITGRVYSLNGVGWLKVDTVTLSMALCNPSMTVTVGTYNPFADYHDVTGVIQHLDFPENGEWLAVASATTANPIAGYVQHIYVPTSGFSTTYTAQTTGNSYDLKAADGCAFSIDAREITIEINRLDGIPVGTYTTGGSLTSVDIAMKNGLWATAGSTDGKFYIFSKDVTSGWYQDYASDSEDSVTCVAMSWRGEMVVVGRSDGSVLMYPVGGGNEDDDDDQTQTFPAQVTVFQDGRLAVGKPVVIEKSETSNPYTWSAYATTQTDAQGKVVIPNAVNGAHYKLTVNEKETVYTASSTSPQLTISVMTPIINCQWKFDAVYDDTAHIITGTYIDKEPAQKITITIVDTNTKTVITQHTVYGDDQLIVNAAGNPDHAYKVNLDAVRFTGNQIRTSKIVHASSIYNIPLGDLDVHMKNAIFVLIIMAVGGLFSYAHSTKGGLLLAALAGGFALFGFTTISYAVIGIAGFVAIVSILIRGSRR